MLLRFNASVCFYNYTHNREEYKGKIIIPKACMIDGWTYRQTYLTIEKHMTLRFGNFVKKGTNILKLNGRTNWT